MPIFSGLGLPHNELVSRIACQTSANKGKSVLDLHQDNFVTIFATMGVNTETVRFFRENMKEANLLNKSVFFAGRAADPTLEHLLTPQIALTAAEYFAVEREQHVLVVTTDMQAHYEACDELARGRDQLSPKHTPVGYYSDMARIVERSGCFGGSNGSITHIPIISMPNDDVTRSAPDTMGSLADGQIYLSRSLYNKQVFPPVDILQSSSNFLRPNIGQLTKRPDHFLAAEEIWKRYARATDFEQVYAVASDRVGPEEVALLNFKHDVTQQFINQGGESRDIDASLDIAVNLL